LVGHRHQVLRVMLQALQVDLGAVQENTRDAAG
jgi:hypothetical protein